MSLPLLPDLSSSISLQNHDIKPFSLKSILLLTCFRFVFFGLQSISQLNILFSRFFIFRSQGFELSIHSKVDIIKLTSTAKQIIIEEKARWSFDDFDHEV